MVSPHHFLLCRHPFECDHLLRLHNDNNYPLFPFTYSPTRNSSNITWAMMNHVDVEHYGPPWLAHNYPISLMLEHLYKSSCENLDLDQGSPTMAFLWWKLVSCPSLAPPYHNHQSLALLPPHHPLIQGWERHLAPWTWTIVWPHRLRRQSGGG